MKRRLNVIEMGEPFDKLLKYIEDCGLDEDLCEGEFGCEDCDESDCDECPRWQILSEVADQICEEMYQLGKKLAKEWVEAQKS